MVEVWKPIKDWESMYEISNFGRVRSVDRVVNRIVKGKCVPTVYHGKILRTSLNRGYEYVRLTDSPFKVSKKVRRLVAEAFIPNPYNLPEINHKDEDKSNNSAWNLEWCDRKYNHHYGTGIERATVNRKHKIAQYDSSGRWIRDWDSASDASRTLGINRARINGCVLGLPEHKTAGGFMWKALEGVIK